MGFTAVCRADVKHKNPFQLFRLLNQGIRSIRKKKAAGLCQITFSAPGCGNFRKKLLNLGLADCFHNIPFPPQACITVAAVVFHQGLGEILIYDFFRNTVSFNSCFLVDILFVCLAFSFHKYGPADQNSWILYHIFQKCLSLFLFSFGHKMYAGV